MTEPERVKRKLEMFAELVELLRTFCRSYQECMTCKGTGEEWDDYEQRIAECSACYGSCEEYIEGWAPHIPSVRKTLKQAEGLINGK